MRCGGAMETRVHCCGCGSHLSQQMAVPGSVAPGNCGKLTLVGTQQGPLRPSGPWAHWAAALEESAPAARVVSRARDRILGNIINLQGGRADPAVRVERDSARCLT